MTRSNRSNNDQRRHGGPKDANADTQGRTKDSHRRSNRNRSKGNKGKTSSSRDIRSRGTSGIPGGTVSADSSGKHESGPDSGSIDASSDRCRFSTSRFGALEVPKTAIVTFPQGIPGFSHARQFVLLDHKPGSIFRWLQCVDVDSLAFVVIDPLLAEPEYPLDPIRTQLKSLGFIGEEEIIVLGICTVPAPPNPPSVNLMAPIGIGLESRQGAQIIMHELGYTARHEFLNSRAA